ncbi:MAG: polysaccharide deacetylase family protein [Actinomycetota bacterium]|nr:polysaccharide deacetylase family protein [Actinomycetota bacterium]
MMSPAQLRTLAERPGIDIGAHTLSHPQLATQLADVQRHEIAGSREHLQALLDREVSLFAYPYGDAQAFDATTKELVDEAGFDAACAVRAGPVEAATDPFDVPRHVVRDWDGATFRERLDRWWTGTG